MSECIICKITGNVAVITLNRPERLNAVNYEMVDTLRVVLDALEADSAVRALILTGAGERAFSAGADIHQFSRSVETGTETALRDFVRRGQALTGRIEAYSKPIIAAVNGIAFGGGCEIVEAAHLAVASERALFGKPEIKLGMPPTFGGTQRLPRLVGRKRGLEFLLTGDPFKPSRAVEMGLINAVVPHSTLMETARHLAGRITRHSAPAVRSIIAAATRGLNMPIAEGLEVEAQQFARTAAGPDLQEGLAAWAARRPPVYVEA